MKNKAIKVISCLAVVALIGGVVIACNNNVSAESMGTEISMDDIKATETPVPTLTSTPSPTLEPTATPTPVPTLTSTPIPTNTPTPTNTPIPTATSTPTPSENDNSDYNDDTHFTDAPVEKEEDTNTEVEEKVEEIKQETSEKVDKAEEKAEQNPDLPKADTSDYEYDDLKKIADFKGITVDELKNKTQEEFDAMEEEYLTHTLFGAAFNPGSSSSGNPGSSSSGSNQQDDEDDKWDMDPDMMPDGFDEDVDWVAGGM